MKTYTVDNLQITAEQVRKLVKENPDILQEDTGVPKEGQDYWYLSATNVLMSYWANNSTDNELLIRNNVYLTKEAAEKADKKRVAFGSVMAFIRSHGLSFTPDWKSEDRDKYQITGWDFYNEEIWIGNNRRCNGSAANLPVFKSEEDRQLVLDNMAEELRTLLRD